MRVQRKQHHAQRQRDREGPRTRRRADPAPRAPRQRAAGQPQQQAERAGFDEHLQHQLVRMAGALAHAAGFGGTRK